MKYFFTLILLSLLSIPIYAQDYQLVWSDEFNSNTLGKNWNTEVVPTPSNNELQYYTSRKSNVKIEDGNLVISARRENYKGRYFTSGRVNSNLKVSFKYGKIEARIKLPKLANGLWPAFWMMGEDIGKVGWPACGEIDIMEAGFSDGIKKGTQEKLYSGCIHWGSSIPEHKMWTSGAVTDSTGITGDYHIFTVVWDEDSLKFYLDNSKEPYYHATISKGTDQYAYFHKPFHILFNLAVGGDYPNILNPEGITALPMAGSEAKMYIDYVRVYKIKNN